MCAFLGLTLRPRFQKKLFKLEFLARLAQKAGNLVPTSEPQTLHPWGGGRCEFVWGGECAPPHPQVVCTTHIDKFEQAVDSGTSLQTVYCFGWDLSAN